MPDSREQVQDSGSLSFKPGLVLRNRHLRHHVIRLEKPGLRPGWWIVEHLQGDSAGQYALPEVTLSEHWQPEEGLRWK